MGDTLKAKTWRNKWTNINKCKCLHTARGRLWSCKQFKVIYRIRRNNNQGSPGNLPSQRWHVSAARGEHQVKNRFVLRTQERKGEDSAKHIKHDKQQVEEINAPCRPCPACEGPASWQSASSCRNCGNWRATQAPEDKKEDFIQSKRKTPRGRELHIRLVFWDKKNASCEHCHLFYQYKTDKRFK